MSSFPHSKGAKIKARVGLGVQGTGRDPNSGRPPNGINTTGRNSVAVGKAKRYKEHLEREAKISRDIKVAKESQLIEKREKDSQKMKFRAEAMAAQKALEDEIALANGVKTVEQLAEEVAIAHQKRLERGVLKALFIHPVIALASPVTGERVFKNRQAMSMYIHDKVQPEEWEENLSRSKQLVAKIIDLFPDDVKATFTRRVPVPKEEDDDKSQEEKIPNAGEDIVFETSFASKQDGLGDVSCTGDAFSDRTSNNATTLSSGATSAAVAGGNKEEQEEEKEKELGKSFSSHTAEVVIAEEAVLCAVPVPKDIPDDELIKLVLASMAQLGLQKTLSLV